MNKKITSSALAALMIAGSTSFSALAAMSNGTVVIGNKAFDLAYANDPKNAEEITNAIVAGGAVYVKDFEGNWIDNTSGKNVEASVIPAVVYKNAEKETSIGAGDKDAVASAAVVSAIDAKTFKVVFNQAPADTSKVVFNVKQAGVDVALTTTWNDAKTEALLTKTGKLVAGDYVVSVKNDTTDLGSTTVTIADQKVAKINVTSTKLGIINGAGSSYDAYLTYKVLDQYGADITESSLANSIIVQSGYGTFNPSKGLASISGLPASILSAGNVVITAYDSTSGVSTSATLAVTTGVGTLSDIQLASALTNVDKKVLTANDQSTIFYLPFTATDISGNVTTNYELIKSGMILTTDSVHTLSDVLTVSNPYVTAQLVRDPSDSKKAAIEVRSDNNRIQVDMPVVITAMTTTGKTSSFSTTLKKQAVVDTFTLQMPAETVSSAQTVTIPFIAYDQNGKQLTKYSDLCPGNVPLVNVSGGTWSENVDGAAVLKTTVPANAGPNSMPHVMTATTPTGKFSTITINVQKATLADELALDNSVFIANMQSGASQTVDFGYDAGGFSVRDQYGRDVDMTTVDASSVANNYVVIAKSGNTSAVGISNYASTGQNQITVSAVGNGISTVTFKLVTKAAFTAVTSSTNYAVFTPAQFDLIAAVDTKTQRMSVLAIDDITGYVIDSVSKPIYASAVSTLANYAASTSRNQDYKANPSVYGTTDSGAKVILAGSPVLSATLSNADDFKVTNGTAYDSVKVVAEKPVDSAKTSASTKLTVTLRGVNGKTYSVNTDITSTTEAPVAATVDASVATELLGVSKDGDKVTIDLSQTASNGFVTGNYITRNKRDDGASVTRTAVYLSAKDQYGKKAMPLASITKSLTSTVSDAGFNVDANGQITLNKSAIVNGQYADISAVASNGLMKTIRIQFVSNDYNPVAEQIAAQALANATASVIKAETTGTVADKAAAQILVTALPAGASQTALQNRIDAIVVPVVAAPTITQPALVLSAGTATVAVDPSNATVYNVNLSTVAGTATFGTLSMNVAPTAKPATISIATTIGSTVVTKTVDFTYDQVTGIVSVNADQFLGAGTTVDTLKALVGTSQTLTVVLTNASGATTYTINLAL